VTILSKVGHFQTVTHHTTIALNTCKNVFVSLFTDSIEKEHFYYISASNPVLISIFIVLLLITFLLLVLAGSKFIRRKQRPILAFGSRPPEPNYHLPRHGTQQPNYDLPRHGNDTSPQQMVTPINCPVYSNQIAKRCPEKDEPEDFGLTEVVTVTLPSKRDLL
jgi:hypothetical protein